MLLRGPSGAGKSELALRALSAGWALVADDRTLVWRSGGRLYGRAPGALQGLIEGRGVGVVAVRSLAWAEIVLVADLAADAAVVERAPEPDVLELCGVALPRAEVWPHGIAALAKLEAALACAATPLGAGP